MAPKASVTCERCKAAPASGLWRVKLRPKGKKLMRLCAACGFSASEWRRFCVFRDERGTEHGASILLVRECRLVHSFTAYGRQR